MFVWFGHQGCYRVRLSYCRSSSTLRLKGRVIFVSIAVIVVRREARSCARRTSICERSGRQCGHGRRRRFLLDQSSLLEIPLWAESCNRFAVNPTRLSGPARWIWQFGQRLRLLGQLSASLSNTGVCYFDPKQWILYICLKVLLPRRSRW
jgi:hypothetical protein